MKNFCRRSRDKGAEPDLSVERIDKILRGATGMQPILVKALDLGRAPTPNEVYGSASGLNAKLECPLRFREGDTVSDVRRLIAVLISRAEEIYTYRSREESDRVEPYWFLRDDEKAPIEHLVNDPSAVEEMLSFTRGYQEAVRLSRGNARDVSGRQSHLVDAVRWSIPSDGLLSSICWALQLHFPNRVSKRDIQKWRLRSDDTPDSIRCALDEFAHDPQVAEVIGKPFSDVPYYRRV